MREGSPQTIYLQDYVPPAYQIDTVELLFKLGEDFTVVHTRLAIRRNPNGQAAATPPLVLDGHGFELGAIDLDGRRLESAEYQVEAESLTIFNIPETCEVAIETRLRPQENTSLEGLYRSSGNFCTQCEAQGFRRITYFLDRPDVMAVYTTTIEADRDAYPVLLSNGNPVASGELDGNRHFATWHDPFPKPSYLFALVAGQLACQQDRYATASGREVELRLYCEAHNLDKCTHALNSLKKAMAWDEQRFGLECDLDIYMIVAVDDFNMGAMENKGLNIFNSQCVLARPQTATDDDYISIEGIIAHEYFHNWTGNRITCRDWFQLSLKEGLTVFRDQSFSADMTLPAVQRIQDARMLRTSQFAEDSGPMAHPVRPQSYMEINNFYTVTVYEKGAEVVRLYETLLGRAGFRKGMDLYFARHDGQAVTTDDFAAAMYDANPDQAHWDLAQFKRWYDQAGTPEVCVTGTWDADDSTYILDISQSTPATPGQEHKQPFVIPLRIALLTTDGRELPLQLQGEPSAQGISRVLTLTGARQQFTFINVPERPVPSLLRDFSAPVKLDHAYTEQELGTLLTHDTDPFSRWEAGQQLALRHLMHLIGEAQQDAALQADDYLLTALAGTLADARLDPVLIAEALTLPGEAYLAECMREIDVDAIHQAREFLRHAVAERLAQPMAERYEANRLVGPYSYNPADAGKRRLKNLCLAYLTCLDTRDYRRLAKVQFEAADNMSDTMGALRALIGTASEERDSALQRFHEDWQHDSLVMDKWFALQAASSTTGTLETIERLMVHPLFSIQNPNKVRAVIGTFAMRNPVNFHAADGSGYRFVADQILRLNAINPQIAARLVSAFGRWRRFDTRRRQRMHTELERILAAENLSRHVHEVASKSLA